MLFNSLVFFALLLPLLGCYWLSRSQTVRLGLLFVGSLVFYGYHHWPSVFLLLFTIGFNYQLGKWQARARSGRLLALAIAINLSLIFWFKYASFVAENANAVLGWFGASLHVPRVPAFLPLGISFFTFQVVAYQVDIYRREIEAESSLLRFAVFKSFFPQLIAGPIVRAVDFLPQLREPLRFKPADFHQGLWLLLAGMGLKIGVADVLAQFANEAFRSPATLSTSGAWTGLYAFGFQLYADFWGYSTMAVGLAALFGLTLPLNFDTPYLSSSLQEFWRRWHITLSVWFRDYVYIPFGGNRRRRDFNLLLTMALAGLWHGAGWPFLLWGVAHGLWLIGERRWGRPATVPSGPGWRWLKTLLVFHGVCLLWVLFRSPDLTVARAYYSRLLLPPFTFSSVPSVLSAWLVVFALAQWPLAWTLKDRRFVEMRLRYQWPLAWACLYFILAYAGARVDFIYFTF
ncbi:MAG: MBOAT family protein [Verrucomicrobiales bacterium]|nr:MBOAT family protein [Verrucomicrobiales bacterium]